MNGRHHDIYKCNHHHPMHDGQEMVDFGTGPFVADKALIPLLRALNEVGLVTRTHDHTVYPDGHATAFVSIILDERVRVEFRHVSEPDADRDTFRGKQEMLISWAPAA